MAWQAVDDLLHPVELFDEPSTPPDVARLSHGVASGDVTSSTAIVWARWTAPASMWVEYGPAAPGDLTDVVGPVHAAAANDYVATARLAGLAPDTSYRYCVMLAPERGDCPTDALGTFRTAPDVPVARPVAFVFSGDLGGAGYCRAEDGGYAIFDAMRAIDPDFFVAAGDMIYADDPCPSARPGGGRNVPGGFPPVTAPTVDWRQPDAARDVYLRHWRYNRADASYQRFLASTPVYAQWDDHEIVNNGGLSWSEGIGAHVFRDGYRSLVAAARDAFLVYAPIDRDRAGEGRLYRSFQWGASLELFLLDTRSYRSRNDAPDGPDKTMLGREQLDWLKQGLVQSPATWKIVSTSVPLSIPTGDIGAVAFGRDGWARGEGSWLASQTGFQRELVDLITHLDVHRVRNVVFIAADLHRPLSIRYEVDLNGDGRPILFHELIAGPLSASTRNLTTPGPDRVLGPTVLYQEAGFFNFGYVRVGPGPDGRISLTADVRGVDGRARPGSLIELAPE